MQSKRLKNGNLNSANKVHTICAVISPLTTQSPVMHTLNKLFATDIFTSNSSGQAAWSAVEGGFTCALGKSMSLISTPFKTKHALYKK